MGYTDKDLMVSTQIAYYDVDLKQYGSEACIKDIIAKDRANHRGTYQRIANELEKAEQKHGKDSVEYQRYRDTLKIYNGIADGEGSYKKYQNWKVVDVCDDNSNSGFYGCVIDTGNGEAIISYRGSESYNLSQKLKDWIQADFGLLNSTLTRQQEVGRKYMNKVLNDPSLNFEKYTGTGHSLGGNLIEDAYMYLSKSYRDKVKVYSFDGPNYSNEYIRELKKYYKQNGWNLQEATHGITHIQWSCVGTIFGKKLPGVNEKTGQTFFDVFGTISLKDLFYKHSVTYLNFDKDENLISGTQDVLAIYVENFTMGVDDVGVGARIDFLLLIGLADRVWNEYLKDELVKMKDISFDTYKKIISNVKQIVKQALEELEQIPQYINDVLNCIDTAFQSATEWFYRQTVGFQYATANPYIVVDTTDMRARADRLRSISARAKRLDFRMNELYLQLDINWTSIIDLANLLKAGVLLDYAGRLDACANYLYQTAEDFDNVEKQIICSQ